MEDRVVVHEFLSSHLSWYFFSIMHVVCCMYGKHHACYVVLHVRKNIKNLISNLYSSVPTQNLRTCTSCLGLCSKT